MSARDGAVSVTDKHGRQIKTAGSLRKAIAWDQLNGEVYKWINGAQVKGLWAFWYEAWRIA
jgi:hypothetical protein